MSQHPNPEYSRTKSGGASFDQWLETLDGICWDVIGCSIHDLPDTATRDAYDAGTTPGDYFTDEIDPGDDRGDSDY